MNRTLPTRTRKLLPLWLVSGFLLVVLLGSNFAWCTVVKKRMKLRDISGRASPIRVSGQLTFSDDASKITRFSYHVKASATNMSQKSVLLMVLHFKASGMGAPGHDDVYCREYFFGDTLEPGATEVHESPGVSFGQPSVNGVPESELRPDARPTATVLVEFVQFSDGSTWGDAEAAADMLETRRQTLLELDVLERTYEQAGEDAFVEELSRINSSLSGIEFLTTTCGNVAGESRCLHDGVWRMIETAKAHEAAMTSGIDPVAEMH